MSQPGGIPPIAIGFVFLILGALLAAWVTAAVRRPPAERPPPLSNPFLMMFATGLWIGLMVGGLGMIFHSSPSAGFLVIAILLAAWYFGRRRRTR